MTSSDSPAFLRGKSTKVEDFYSVFLDLLKCKLRYFPRTSLRGDSMEQKVMLMTCSNSVNLQLLNHCRFVSPASFVYGTNEKDSPVTCMEENINFTFHVRVFLCKSIILVLKVNA